MLLLLSPGEAAPALDHELASSPFPWREMKGQLQLDPPRPPADQLGPILDAQRWAQSPEVCMSLLERCLPAHASCKRCL